MGKWYSTKRATKVIEESGKTLVYYHQTPVVTFDKEYVTLRNDGFLTKTTKERINQASEVYKLGFSVSQLNYKWYVSFKGHQPTLEFEDGMTFRLHDYTICDMCKLDLLKEYY